MISIDEMNDIQLVLGVKFPNIYKLFFMLKESCIVDGFKIMCIPTKSVKTGVIEATNILRAKRPDLPKDLVPFVFWGDQVFCMDLSRSNGSDAPVVGTLLNKEYKLVESSSEKQNMFFRAFF